jgi:hypothetical protein
MQDVKAAAAAADWKGGAVLAGLCSVRRRARGEAARGRGGAAAHAAPEHRVPANAAGCGVHLG